MSLKLSDKRNLIVQFVKSNPNYRPSDVYNYFKKLNIPRSTVFNIVKQTNNGVLSERKLGSGPKLTKMTQGKLKKFVEFSENCSKSQRYIAKKFSISKTHVQRLMKKANIKYHRTIQAPKSTPAQEKKQKLRIRKMLQGDFEKSANKDIVEDDESYFPLDRSQGSGYYASSSVNTPDHIRFHKKSKFESKLCVWIAVSSKGKSAPYFIPAKCALNSDLYVKNCIEKRFSPFLQLNYPQNDYIFWPDGATAHYARKTVAKLDELNVNYVAKEDNPPNVPQLRAIEKFWAHLKDKVYQSGWKADNFDQLRARIRSKLKEFDEAYFERLFRSTHSKLWKAHKHGPLSVLNK